MKAIGPTLILLCLTAALCSCATPQRHFVDAAFDLNYVKRVAVLPFDNNTSEKHAAARFRDIVTTEALSRGLFEVVERGELQRFLLEELVRKDHESLDVKAAQKLGSALGVQAYLAGSVEDFSEARNGSYSYPVVAATLRLVDVKTGKIVWQAGDQLSGYRTVDRLFGFASEDINQVSFALASKMLTTLGGRR